MAGVDIVSSGEGRFSLKGELSFSTTPALLESSESLFRGAGRLDIDLKGVVHADSAGLALFIEWLRVAEQMGKPIRFLNAPAQMMAMAKLTGLDDILPLVSG